MTTLQNAWASPAGANVDESGLPLLLRPREAALFLGISERSLWSLGDSGAIPVVRIGRSVRFDRRDLIAWVDRQKNRAVDDGAAAV